jgi:hypothetical protein
MMIVSRAAWGARPPRRRSFVNWPAGVDLWVHHSAGPAPRDSFEAEKAEVRRIQNFHMDTRGWNDVGYGYLAAPSGRVYAGRGFEVHAAHSPGKNHEPSVCLLGDYGTAIPSDAIHRAVYAVDDLVNAGEFRGHRENSATSCPGDAAMRIIVNGPPPPTARPVHYFEELPFSQGGRGPVIVGQAAGYAQRRVMVAKLAAFKAAHPRTPVSTMREGDDGSGVELPRFRGHLNIGGSGLREGVHDGTHATALPGRVPRRGGAPGALHRALGARAGA